MKSLYHVFVILLFSLFGYAQKHERWEVKTITDNFEPNFHSVKKITVATIQPKVKIGIKNTEPRLQMEKQMVSITGTVTRLKLESGMTGDNDYHIEVSDGTVGDSTIVCEAIDPEDSTAATSPMLPRFLKVRNFVKNLKVGDKVKFTGILFQDKYHSPSQNRTRNFVEIHPILIARKVN